MSKYNEILKNWETPQGKSTEEAWMVMQSKIAKTGSDSAKVVRFSWKPMAAVAAAAAIIIGLIVLWPNEALVKFSANHGEHTEVILPDQSIVILNASSSVAYPENWEREREVQLTGQAFFEVVKGGKFHVVTSNGVVEVLGTSFDVNARDRHFVVSCRTGKVKVTSKNEMVEIVPGFKAELVDGQLIVGEFDLAAGDWRSGEFHFEKTPLGEVFLEIERQFNIHVQTPDISSRVYTGRFSSKNIQEALQLVCLPMGLKFEIKDNIVFVTEVAEENR